MNQSIISKLERALARAEEEAPLQKTLSICMIQAPAAHLRKVLALLHAVQAAELQCTRSRFQGGEMWVGSVSVCGTCDDCKIHLARAALEEE